VNILSGRVWKYGNNINTDVIFPGKYTYTVTDPQEMARIALEDLDPDFAKSVRPGDIIVAGSNFGCGSSREQAAFCLKYARVGAVIAESFSRLFFRNCINAGLPALTLKQTGDFKSKEKISIDLQKGEILTLYGIYQFPPLPDEIVAIFNDGGLIPHVRKQLKAQQNEEKKHG
jgi:3-isopropylmalate/(R)-2-methylmalate dehydratase small subunit